MFIVREPKKNRLKPRRGDMGPLGACHAAPTGLKTVVGVRGGYKHVAPPELEPCRIREREVAGANRVGGGFSPPASHTTGHAGPRPAVPGSPCGRSSTLSLSR
jgi:hypothetical protein